MVEAQHVIHAWAPPEPPGVRIKLERGQRSSYGWEIAATGETVAAALALIRAADAALRAEFTADDGKE